MRLWLLLLIALLANFCTAQKVKRQADLADEGSNELEEPTDAAEHHDEAVESEEHTEGNEAESETHDEQNEQEEEAEHEEPQDNGEDEQTEEADEAEPQVAEQEEEEEGTEGTDDSAADENVEAEIAEETEEPASADDETEQPAGAEPTDEETETGDASGETESLSADIASDAPKAEKAVEAAAEEPWTDELGWIHYPWKKYPISKHRYTHTRDCGCQIKWIKRVYKRRQPKPCVYLAKSTFVKFPRKCRHHHPHFPLVHHHHHVHRPCRRHHHHVFHRKPTRTVQHVVVHHRSKPCFNKPIVRHVTRVHHRPARYHGGYHSRV